MSSRGSFLEAKRAECWTLGVQQREALLRQYMAVNRMQERPFLKDVIDDLIEEVQGARLRYEVLPLNTFAQTELANGRIEVSINSRIGEMPGVKDAIGVANVAKWHESIHVARDVEGGISNAQDLQVALPGFGAQRPSLIVCRTQGAAESKVPEREFVAENAALAAAIAGPDLMRCPAFQQFQRLAAGGGDLGTTAWRPLYDTAEAIGVNISALARYFQQRRVFRIVAQDGKQRIVAAPQLFQGLEGL